MRGAFAGGVKGTWRGHIRPICLSHLSASLAKLLWEVSRHGEAVAALGACTRVTVFSLSFPCCSLNPLFSVLCPMATEKGLWDLKAVINPRLKPRWLNPLCSLSPSSLCSTAPTLAPAWGQTLDPRGGLTGVGRDSPPLPRSKVSLPAPVSMLLQGPAPEGRGCRVLPPRTGQDWAGGKQRDFPLCSDLHRHGAWGGGCLGPSSAFNTPSSSSAWPPAPPGTSPGLSGSGDHRPGQPQGLILLNHVLVGGPKGFGHAFGASPRVTRTWRISAPMTVPLPSLSKTRSPST